MIRMKDECVGRFSVDVELANFGDVEGARRGLMPAESIRRLVLSGVVDTGAAYLVIPEDTARQLDVPFVGQARVRYADGRTATRPIARGIQLSWGGRSSLFDAIVEPGRDSALIGAIVLEALDLVADCKAQRLTPRDPNQIISEIE